MKYKLLLGGNRNVMRDFFVHMDLHFECMSTSDYHDDIMLHKKYFEPNAYVRMVGKEVSKEIDHLRAMRNDFTSEELPIIIVGDPEVCSYIENEALELFQLSIRRPATPKKIQDTIVEYFEKEAAEREKQEAEMQERKQRAEEAKRKKQIAEQGYSILAVDDDKLVLKLLKTSLADEYSVTTVSSAKMAAKFLENRTADLILLDYEMPDVSGADMMRILQKTPSTANIPVVFLTGVTDRDRIREVLALQPKGYLLKPIDIQKLRNTISSILKND